MPFVYFPFRYPMKCPNAFRCFVPRWLICISNCLVYFSTSGTTFILYHIIWPMNYLYLSMSAGAFSLLSLKVVPGVPGVFEYWRHSQETSLFCLPIYWCLPPWSFFVQTFIVMTPFVLHSKKILHFHWLLNVKLQLDHILNTFQYLRPY